MFSIVIYPSYMPAWKVVQALYKVDRAMQQSFKLRAVPAEVLDTLATNWKIERIKIIQMHCSAILVLVN